MNKLEGKSAFVTGGASGIGPGIASVFVEAGLNAVLADLRVDHIESALAGLEAHGQSDHVHAIQLDVTDRAAMAEAAIVAISQAIRPNLAEAGIGVSVLCPGPVATNIHGVKENRPPHFSVGEAFRSVEKAGGTKVPIPNEMTPAQAGQLILDAVRNDELYIITRGEWRSWAEARQEAILKAMPSHTDPELLAMLNAVQPGKPED